MRNKFIRIPLMILAGIAAVIAFGYITMQLWNALVPELFHGSAITYRQAIGLLILAKIFFGGMHGRGHKHGHKRKCCSKKEDYDVKFKDFSPEDREKIKAIMKEKCCSDDSHSSCCSDKSSKECC